MIVDGSVSLGPVAAAGSAVSTDTFVLRFPASALTRPPALVWNVVVQPVGGGGAATKLRVRPVANVRAGDPFTVVVDALDANDVLDTSFAGPVTLVGLQPAIGALGQTGFDAPVISGGLATFTGLSISNAADGYSFSAQATLGGNPVIDSLDAAFNVTARQLAVTTAIPDRRAGELLSATVEARDANNAIAENFSGSVNLDAAAAGGSNFTGGTQTTAAVGGSATFNNLVLNNAANNYTATASTAGASRSISAEKSGGPPACPAAARPALQVSDGRARSTVRVN